MIRRNVMWCCLNSNKRQADDRQFFFVSKILGSYHISETEQAERCFVLYFSSSSSQVP